MLTFSVSAVQRFDDITVVMTFSVSAVQRFDDNKCCADFFRACGSAFFEEWLKC